MSLKRKNMDAPNNEHEQRRLANIARNRENMDAPSSEYEQRRLANIARNKEQLESLKFPTMNAVVQRPKKRTKKTYHAPTDGHNLRPRPQKDIANEQIADDLDYEPTGDFLCDNEDLLSDTRKKRKGRGITQMQDIFSRTTDMPKISVTLNEFGQPVGSSARKLSSVIRCQVRKKLSIGFHDWRLVCPKKKLAVWNDLKVFYDLDEAAKVWFMATAARKWKEYKADLKAKFFDESLTDQELKERVGDNVNAADWAYLIAFWRSPKSEARTERGKANRAKLLQHHTSGSVSHACRRHDLGIKLGRTSQRDELYIKTHTRKNGVPLRQAAPIISQLQAIVEDRPELKDRSIQEGDVYAAVCGAKEPKGRVRVLGLGPTPQEICTPGLKSYMPTRLQLEILARKNAEQRLKEFEEAEERRMARESQHGETFSQDGSNSRQHLSPRSEEHVDAHYDGQCEDNDNSMDNEDCDQDIEDESWLVHRKVTETPPVSVFNATSARRNEVAQSVPAINDSRRTRNEVAQSIPAINAASTPRNEDAPRFAHDTLVGKEVFLYGMLRYELPVAKGTILSTDPKTMVGGDLLGNQFCEVMVDVVMKRDALLPRSYDHMETMAGAYICQLRGHTID